MDEENISQERLGKLIENESYMVGKVFAPVENKGYQIIGHSVEVYQAPVDRFKRIFISVENDKYKAIQDNMDLQGCLKLPLTKEYTIYYVFKESAKDLSYMFAGCSNLTSLDLTNFKNPQIEDMSFMFAKCTKLTNLDVSKFNTENVTDMYGMFAECSNLINLDVSKFNTQNVTNMSYMFYGCEKLKSINFGENFNTQNVTTMKGMFAECINLINLDVSNFNTEKVTDMGLMFYKCGSLQSIIFRKDFFRGENKYINKMFYECKNLKTFYFPEICIQQASEKSNGLSFIDVFSLCANLNGVKVSCWRRVFCCQTYKSTFTIKEVWDIIKQNAKSVGNSENLNLINTTKNDNNINENNYPVKIN